MINPTWLNTFKTLVEIGHFTQTAEKLYMTQPGVTQHIKKLEHACQHALLKRENKSVELTEQGRVVYQYALELERREQGLMEELNFDDPTSGRCRLACSGARALSLYPEMLNIQKSLPNLDIHLEAAPNHSILKKVETGEIDLGIVAEKPNPSRFDFTPIGYESMCLVLPIEKKEQPITPQLLLELGSIDHPDAEHYMGILFEDCGIDELKSIKLTDIPSRGFINQLSQILLPVSMGIGFTVLPLSAVEAFPERDKLYIAPLVNQVEEELFLVSKKGRTLPKRFDTLKQHLWP